MQHATPRRGRQAREHPLNLHEYQARKLFHEYGIPAPPGPAAASVREALDHAAALGGDSWVVKAQVHAGGRGKAGGVKRVTGMDELERCVRTMLGSRLVTGQSDKAGYPVHCVAIQRTEEIRRELYLGMLVDRGRRRVAVVASASGGMDIEAVAAKDPEAIHTVAIDPVAGLQGYQCRTLGFALGLDAAQRRQLGDVLARMYRLFLEKDLGLIEINPLIVDGEDKLSALDAKINIDDNALFRQAALAEWRDATQEDERETRAKHYDLNYVALDGDIGCMVNGAGLAMATMDIIQLHGGRPANFLDVGGGATAERVAEAFRIITGDAGVRSILVNIFGGIVRCDLIAEGIVQAVGGIDAIPPVIARLEGTRVAEGRRMLEHSGLNIATAADLTDAAQQAIAAARR